MSKTAQSVWGCVEFDAISRDFDYANYVDFHERTKCIGAVVSPSTYIHLRNAFHQAMEDDKDFQLPPGVAS